MNPRELPVYLHRTTIVESLTRHRVIVVESPTGSGKTTQLPVILHEAGFSESGRIGVTQPRRIAAVSVCEFVARQLNVQVPDMVGYKMRFYDHTGPDTRIKIMTDGILLQEIKSDERLSAYSVMIVDEAHERSLNIDFVLGLIKRALELRDDLFLIISSATINAEVFSEYFDHCPVVRIETPMYPVQVIYDSPKAPDPVRGERWSERETQSLEYDALIGRIVSTIGKLVEERFPGDILVFLPGEKAIKDCIVELYSLPIREALHILPLYGRLSKEEQDEVFPPAPKGKKKVVVATNIAETSITIDGVTAVIDSGKAKTNFYNPRTYTSALVEGPISKASANQRRGRAGRTRPGRCYRLYGKRDFEARPLFSTEEIYRTDLSEVVLRMAELGIRDFEEFDFISSPGTGNIRAAVHTLRMMDALDEDRALTAIGEMMVRFPLLPRHSRILVEAIREYPDVMDEVLTAVSFLTSQTPFLLPQGEEIQARKAHHRYRDDLGDFVSYLRLFAAYSTAEHKERFCDSRYLDPRMMAEIANVKEQLGQIVSDMGIPLISGGPRADYLIAIARGLLQFVCAHTGRGVYQSLTAERIMIHPGSVMFRATPDFIVAGEIVRTSRTYARSVSPLERSWLRKVSIELFEGLAAGERRRARGTRDSSASRSGPVAGGRTAGRDTTWQIRIGGAAFEIVPYKGKKKIVVLPWERLGNLVRNRVPPVPSNQRALRARIELGGRTIMDGERLGTVLRAASHLPEHLEVRGGWPDHRRFTDKSLQELTGHLDRILDVVPARKSGPQLGFLALYSNPAGQYWFKPIRHFYTAVHESLATLEQIADDLDEQPTGNVVEAINRAYRRLAEIIERDDE